MGDMKDADRGGSHGFDDLDGDPFADLTRLLEEPWEPVSASNPVLPASCATASTHSPMDAQETVSDEAGSGRELAFDQDSAVTPPEVFDDGAGEAPGFSEDEFLDALADAIETDAAALQTVEATSLPQAMQSARQNIAEGPAPHESRQAAAWQFPVAHEPAGASYAGWVAPRAVAAPGKVATSDVVPAVPMQGRDGGEEAPGNDLENALRGLSAPANPREAPLQRSESFAPERAQHETSADPVAFSVDDFEELIASELAVMREPPAPRPQPIRVAPASTPALHEHASHGAPEHDDDDDDGFASDAMSAMASQESRRFGGRGALMLGGSVMALALVGAVGVFAFSGTGGGARIGAEPLLIKADLEPVKVLPENPGGKSIPNQHKAVYERVQSAQAPTAPSQATLVSAADEPVDLPTEEEPSDLPGVQFYDSDSLLTVDEEARVTDDGSTSAGADVDGPVPVLQPRRVRTMMVRADGTLVASDAVPETSMEALRSPAVAMTDAASRPIDVASAATVGDLMETGSVASVTDTAVLGGVAVAAAAPTAAPAGIGGIEGAQAYAPAEPAATAVPAAEAAAMAAASGEAAAVPVNDYGGYYVQISSQPSEVLAQDSSRDLGERYSGVLAGRDIVIQAAEIPGKGTYHRVRVMAGSQDEASGLCNQLKSAGGSCFVSR